MDTAMHSYYRMCSLTIECVLHTNEHGVDIPMDTAMQERAESQRAEDKRKHNELEVQTSPLQPLLSSLQHFHSLSTLDTRILDIYNFLDCDGSGALSKVKNRPLLLIHRPLLLIRRPLLLILRPLLLISRPLLLISRPLLPDTHRPFLTLRM